MNNCPMCGGYGQCSILGEKCIDKRGYEECTAIIKAHYHGMVSAEFGNFHKRITELDAERDSILGWASLLRKEKGA